MGNGSGPGRLNSKVFTNSFAGKNNAAYAPFWLRNMGDSFYGLSKPQYSWQTYHQLAANGAGSGNRADRWERVHSLQPISFVPPAPLR